MCPCMLKKGRSVGTQQLRRMGNSPASLPLVCRIRSCTPWGLGQAALSPPAAPASQQSP